jgi:hypothetical protein
MPFCIPFYCLNLLRNGNVGNFLRFNFHWPFLCVVRCDIITIIIIVLS